MTKGVFGRAVEKHWLEVPITSEKHVWHNCVDAVDSCTFHLCRVWSTGFPCSMAPLSLWWALLGVTLVLRAAWYPL
jgi:hypothetical protein